MFWSICAGSERKLRNMTKITKNRQRSTTFFKCIISRGHSCSPTSLKIWIYLTEIGYCTCTVYLCNVGIVYRTEYVFNEFSSCKGCKDWTELYNCQPCQPQICTWTSVVTCRFTASAYRLLYAYNNLRFC